MLQSEFYERTGIETGADEYAEIELAYYGFSGDKNNFCSIVSMLSDEPKKLDEFLTTCYTADRSNTDLPNHGVIGYCDEFTTNKINFHFYISVRFEIKRLEDKFKYVDWNCVS